jgi:hypothetical protein
MEQAKLFLDQARVFLEKALAVIFDIVTRGGDPLILAAAVILFLFGLLVLYKKGPWLGIPITLASVLLILMAILGQLLSF